MLIEGEGVLAPEVATVASHAFHRSWAFIERDPILAGHDRAALQAELAQRIVAIAGTGERDLLRIANHAIALLRERLGERARRA